jgi:nucleoid-associated protein YgaU
MAVTTDQLLEQLKQKYAGAFSEIQQQQIRLTHVHIVDGKLFLQGDAPSEAAKNRVWDVIKTINPGWQADLIADIRVAETGQSQTQSSASASSRGTRQYTVQAGDSLSKIAKQFYGDANAYMKIFEANRDKLKDPNVIHPGQQLTIP